VKLTAEGPLRCGINVDVFSKCVICNFASLIKEEEMEGACSMHASYEKYISSFGMKT
jgi:hypothetical protein